MTKLQVPEGMLKAALDVAPGASEELSDYIPRALEAALQHLSEHPIVPTGEWCNHMIHEWRPPDEEEPMFPRWIAVEFQRVMFLAEPEVPEEVKELMQKWGGKFDEPILEAFRRGQRSKGSV